MFGSDPSRKVGFMPLPTAKVFGEFLTAWSRQMEGGHRSSSGRRPNATVPHQRNGPYFGGLVLGARHLRSAHQIPFITFETPFCNGRMIAPLVAFRHEATSLMLVSTKLQDVAFKPPTGVTPGRPFLHGLTYNDAAGQIEMTRLKAKRSD